MTREELIRNYLLGKLGDEKMAEVEQLIQSDPDYKKEVEFQKDLKAAFSDLERERIKNKLRSFEEKLHSPKQKSRTGWMVAASIIAIVGLGLWFFNNSMDTDQLYMAYFEPYDNVVEPITRGESMESFKKDIFIAYEKGEYTKAAKGFDELYQNSGESYYLLYQANALMADEQPKKAAPLLKKQLESEDEFAEKSRWYLALAYLKTQQTEAAKVLLKEIQLQKTYKYKEAEIILEELE